MRLLNSWLAWRRAREHAKHAINLLTTHQLEHGGKTLEVAKTDKGLLVIFPYAKKVSASEVIDFMNRENQEQRKMEWRGYVDPEAFSDVPRPYERMLHRVSGPFEITSAKRRGALKVMRKIRKPTANSMTTPLEEALLLLKARGLGYNCELPVAVFLGRGNFPEMLFTTHLKGKTTEAVPINLKVAFNDRLAKRRRKPVFFDAEAYRDTVPEIVKQANEFRKKLKRL